MSKKDIENIKNRALLPNGFVDLLPPFAELEAKSIQLLMDRFSSFGYRRIKPPLIEFEETLLCSGIGSALSDDTFRLTDPVNGRMLGIRSDSTTQVARIVSSRLENEPRPLRLTYANDVLRTNGSQMRTERQFTQVGCELVSDENPCDSDVEICVLAVLGLKDLGIENITLDLTIPSFVSHVLGDMNDVSLIEKAVKQRDSDALYAMDCAQAHILAKAMEASGAAENILPILSDINLDKALDDNITHLKHVCAGIEKALQELEIEDVSLTIDVLEVAGFEYHKNLGFTLFAAGSYGELGSGGSYDLHFGVSGSSEIARGFTLYMDSILRAVDTVIDKKCVFVANTEPWNVVARIQNQGWVVVRGVTPKGCTHIYKDKEIKEFKSEGLS